MGFNTDRDLQIVDFIDLFEKSCSSYTHSIFQDLTENSCFIRIFKLFYQCIKVLKMDSEEICTDDYSDYSLENLKNFKVMSDRPEIFLQRIQNLNNCIDLNNN